VSGGLVGTWTTGQAQGQSHRVSSGDISISSCGHSVCYGASEVSAAKMHFHVPRSIKGMYGGKTGRCGAVCCGRWHGRGRGRVKGQGKGRIHVSHKREGASPSYAGHGHYLFTGGVVRIPRLFFA